MSYVLLVTKSEQETISTFANAHSELELLGSRIDICAAWLVPNPTPEKLATLETMPGYVGIVDLQTA